MGAFINVTISEKRNGQPTGNSFKIKISPDAILTIRHRNVNDYLIIIKPEYEKSVKGGTGIMEDYTISAEEKEIKDLL